MSPAAPRITTVIPTYRRPELLKRAVQSVLNQTYPHVQALVLDNASGDATAQVVAEIAARDPRVKYICHAENIGALANFQAGYAAVDSEYFSFLSDDDMLLPHFYQTALDTLRLHPEARFFCGQAVLYQQDDGSHRLMPRRVWESRCYQPQEGTPLTVDKHFIWTSCLFATAIRDVIGALDTNEAMDHAFLIRASAHFPFVVRMLPCALVTWWDAGFSSRTPVQANITSFTEMIEAVTTECPLPPELLAKIRITLGEKVKMVVERKLRAAFDARDWESVAAAEQYLRQVHALKGRLWLRAWLAQPARRGGLLDRLTRWWIQRHHASRKARQQQKQEPQSAEALVRQYTLNPAPGATLNPAPGATPEPGRTQSA